MRIAAVLTLLILFFASFQALGAGHSLEVSVETPKDGAILTTNVTNLRFGVSGDVPAVVHVSLNGADVLAANFTPPEQTFELELELRLGYNAVYVSAFNSSAGIGDLEKVEVWYKGEEGLPVRWELDPRRADVVPGETVTFKGRLCGYRVWNPPVLSPLPNREIEVYVKENTNFHDYGRLVGDVFTDENGAFSFPWTFTDSGGYVVTFRFPGDDLYAPGTAQANVYVDSSGGGGSGGGSSGNAPARGVWIVKPRDGDVLSGTVLVEAISTEGAPELYVDSEDFGEMTPMVFTEHYMALVDTTEFEDGNHTFTVVAGNRSDTVVVAFDNEPEESGTIKAVIVAPVDGATVPEAFRFVVDAAWEGVCGEPEFTFYVNGRPIPELALQTVPRSPTPPECSGEVTATGLVDLGSLNLTEGEEVVFEAVVEVGNATAHATATYTYVPSPGYRPSATVHVGPSGYVVKTEEPVAAVFMVGSDGSLIRGRQESATTWFIPFGGGFALDWNLPEILVVGLGGHFANYTIFGGGASAWFDEVSGSPWLAFLGFMLLVGLVVWVLRPRGRRRR